jgi:uncharacterized membrane protein YvlD (DUF360 family)
MRFLLKKYLSVTVAIYLLIQIVSGFKVGNGWNGLFYSSLILSILMFIAKPLIDLIMLPINILSLNLVSWLFNILLVYIWSLLAKDVSFTPFNFPQISVGPLMISSFLMVKWQVIVLSSIILTLIIRIFDAILK